MTASWQHTGRAILTAVVLLGTLVISGCNDGSDESASPPDGSGSGTGNSPPQITGTPPPSIAIGENYSFQPDASDPDGDTLTFSIEAKPAWASFDSAIGALSGTPQAGDEGPYGGIAIVVSDGAATDSLDFSVTVNQIGTGSATLSWTAPTENSDGSPLTDLAGYRIHYGITQGNYSEQIQIDNPGLTTYVVENLSPNTWYFVATSFDTEGIESQFSGVAVKTVE